LEIVIVELVGVISQPGGILSANSIMKVSSPLPSLVNVNSKFLFPLRAIPTSVVASVMLSPYI